MARSRLQFTLRTVFIIVFLCAIVCSSVECEMNARSRFASVVGVVGKALAQTEQEVDEELYGNWLKEARVNPTFPLFSRDFPSAQAGIGSVVGNAGSNHGRASDYFGSHQPWTVRRHLLSPKTDFSKTPWGRAASDTGADAINLTIRCDRPCSIISRQTSVSITIHRAAENQLLLDRLKSEFDKAGLSCVVTED